MNSPEHSHNHPPFNEEEWLRLIFLLNDTQHWINEMITNALLQVPMKDRKKLFRKTYYMNIAALTHILERHYYKIPRHPETSKFTISIIEILTYLRNASTEVATQVPGSLTFQRVIDAGTVIGFDRNRIPTSHITVLTDSGGRILTAFPGNKLYNANLAIPSFYETEAL
ncbi:MAG TPA: hypothetical protein VJ647_01425 [Chitinophagaceae bacterium]|nr:hypothetical protein [Chitinophagaceae bacterium]